MTKSYEDIIDLPHPTSVKHPRMSPMDRAAQFSPFAALAGHGAAIRETARLTAGRVELTEDIKAELDIKLRLVAGLEKRMDVSITYFQEDRKKAGGSYKTVSSIIKKIDDVQRVVVMMDGERIPIDNIYEIENEYLRSLL